MVLMRFFVRPSTAAIIEMAARETGSSKEQLGREILDAWASTYHPRRKEA